MPVINKKVSKGNQDARYTETIKTKGICIRIDIRSDFYAFQSWAHCSVCSEKDLQWNILVDIHYGIMKTKVGSYSKGPTEADFKADRDELVRQASEILNIDFA